MNISNTFGLNINETEPYYLTGFIDHECVRLFDGGSGRQLNLAN